MGKSISWRRGIEPVIAAVILIAVAIVVAVAVVGWLLGLWGNLSGGNPQITLVNPVLCAGNSTIEAAVYLRNQGTGSDKILAIQLEYGGGTFSGSVITSPQNVTKIVSGTTLSLSGGNTVPANVAGWLYIQFNNVNKVISAGDTVAIKIMFEKSGTQTVYATAQNC